MAEIESNPGLPTKPEPRGSVVKSVFVPFFVRYWKDLGLAGVLLAGVFTFATLRAQMDSLRQEVERRQNETRQEIDRMRSENTRDIERRQAETLREVERLRTETAGTKEFLAKWSACLEKKEDTGMRYKFYPATLECALAAPLNH